MRVADYISSRVDSSYSCCFLSRGDDRAIPEHIAIRHSRCVERKSRISLVVEKYQSSGAGRAFSEKMYGFTRSEISGGDIAPRSCGRVHTSRGPPQNIHRSLGHHNFHDRLSVARAGDSSRFGICVAAAADQRRIAHPPRQFTARASRRSRCEQPAGAVHSNGAHSSLLMAPMMLRSVLIFFAAQPRFPLRRAYQFFRRAQRDSLFFREAFRAFSRQHHVRTLFQNRARQPDRISNVLQSGRGARLQRRSVHDDGVALHPPVQVQMRAKSRVEDRIIFEHHDRGFNRVERGAASLENRPSRFERAMAAGFARLNGFIRNIPRAAVND